MPRDLETEQYLRIVAEVHTEWALANTPARFAPEGHPEGSDYNVETLDVEATPEQEAELDRMILERLDAVGLAHRYRRSWATPPER